MRFKQLMKTFKEFSKRNVESIEEFGSVPDLCVLLNEKAKVADIIPLRFENSDDKDLMRKALLQHIAESGAKAYILVQNALMTKIDKNTEEHERMDVVIMSLITPKRQMMEVSHIDIKNKKILDTDVHDSKDLPKGDEFCSEWNLWNDKNLPEVAKVYQRIKDENPEAYKEVQ